MFLLILIFLNLKRRRNNSLLHLNNTFLKLLNFNLRNTNFILNLSSNLFRTISIPIHHHFSALAKKRYASDDNLLRVIESEIDDAVEEALDLERRRGDVSISPSVLSDKAADEVDYCIDAGITGNVTRYINHSFAPNLFVQCVFSDRHDVKLARIVLFAADNIPPLQELSYDYGYAKDSVVDKEGKIKHMACYCGAPDCKKWMF